MTTAVVKGGSAPKLLGLWAHLHKFRVPTFELLVVLADKCWAPSSAADLRIWTAEVLPHYGKMQQKKTENKTKNIIIKKLWEDATGANGVG